MVAIVTSENLLCEIKAMLACLNFPHKIRVNVGMNLGACQLLSIARMQEALETQSICAYFLVARQLILRLET